jgi:hypothetical protein
VSLRAWQDTWLQLMLSPHDQARILAGARTELTADEWQALQALPPERLQVIAAAVQRGRVSVLQSSLPRTLRHTLSETGSLAERYAQAFPAAAVYPPALGLKPWLTWLKQQPEISHHPLLQQLIEAEICLNECHFYAPPDRPVSDQPGPCLAPCCGLVVAGPDLEALLRGWKTPDSCQPDPLQGWLLARGPAQFECLSLHWALYTLLQRLDGQKGWSEHLHELIEIWPELHQQAQALRAWEPWLRQREWIQ